MISTRFVAKVLREVGFPVSVNDRRNCSPFVSRQVEVFSSREQIWINVFGVCPLVECKGKTAYEDWKRDCENQERLVADALSERGINLWAPIQFHKDIDGNDFVNYSSGFYYVVQN